MWQVPSDVQWKTDNGVKEHLDADVMRSNAWRFPLLFSKLKVLLYQGQFDWKDGSASNRRWISALNWPGKDAFINTKQKLWSRKVVTTDNTISKPCGWATEVLGFNLTEVVVAGAGHLVPMDQPEAAKDMIMRFVLGKNFSD